MYVDTTLRHRRNFTVWGPWNKVIWPLWEEGPSLTMHYKHSVQHPLCGH